LSQELMLTYQGGIYQPSDCDTGFNGSLACVLFGGTISLTNDTSGLDYFLTGLTIAINSMPAGATVNDVGDFNNENYFFGVTRGLLGPDDTGFYDPIAMSDTYTGGIFEVDVSPTAPFGDYSGVATLLYSDSNGVACTACPTANFDVDVVPEPGVWALTAAGLAALALRRRTR
jgi:hypothetical protein